MSVAEVRELGAHTPTVESVISRLHRHIGRIKNITVIVTWDDDSADVYSDTHSLGIACFHSVLMQKSTQDLIEEQP